MLFAALLIMLPCYLGASVDWNYITINLGNKGEVHVTERMQISFESSGNESKVLEELTSNQDFRAWASAVPEIGTHVTEPKEPVRLSKGQITTSKESKSLELTLEYDAEPLTPVKKGRYLKYTFPAERLSFYSNETHTVTLPRQTQLWIKVENSENVKILEKVPDPYWDTYIENNMFKVTGWTGGKTFPDFKFVYEAEEPLTESFTIRDFAEKMFLFLLNNPAYTVSLAVLLAIMLVYRKQIFGLLSEGAVSEEEIEIPRD